MNKILKLSDKYKNYLLKRKDKEQIVDVKLTDGRYLKKLKVINYDSIEDVDFTLEDITLLHLSYKSRENYSKDYNSKLSTIQIDRTLHKELKEYLTTKELTIREWIEELIKDKMNV